MLPFHWASFDVQKFLKVLNFDLNNEQYLFKKTQSIHLKNFYLSSMWLFALLCWRRAMEEMKLGREADNMESPPV